MKLQQEIRFCTSSDGTRIAYARSGRGMPIVHTAHWLTHIEAELESPVWHPWLEQWSRMGLVIRYDERGCGLSDREVADTSLEAQVADLEAVVDAAGLDHFVLFAQSQGGAIAATYAARYPQRVSRLIFLDAFAQGALRRDIPDDAKQTARLLVDLVRLGWGQPNTAFNRIFTELFIPDAPPEMARSFDEMQRLSTSPTQASRILATVNEFDATEALAAIRAPTLVLHARGDARVPFEEGRKLAAAIPGARLIALDSRNHTPMPDEPAWCEFFGAVGEFIGAAATPTAGDGVFAALTERERELLEHLARGCDNAQIAAHLELAEKTVRNRITAIFDKLGVENRAQAIVRARQAGFGQ